VRLGLPGLANWPTVSPDADGTHAAVLIDQYRNQAIDTVELADGTVIGVRYRIRTDGAIRPASLAHAILWKLRHVGNAGRRCRTVGPARVSPGLRLGTSPLVAVGHPITRLPGRAAAAAWWTRTYHETQRSPTNTRVTGKTRGTGNEADMQPHIRVSDADRERVVDLLQRHTSDGRLSLDEFSTRVDAAQRARTHGELAVITADLPAQPESPGGGRRPLVLGLIIAGIVLALLIIAAVVAGIAGMGHMGPMMRH
jgi:hypothetical protein